MKRSKIFLSVTACVLGVAAFAATKARFTGVQTYGCTVNDGLKTSTKACFTAGTGIRSHTTQCTLSTNKLFTCAHRVKEVYKTAE
jgi:hypothetical protein